MFDYLRFRYRRAIRRLRRDNRIIRRWIINYVNRHIWGKWHQLGVVRRFLIAWLAVLFIGGIGLLQQLGGLNRAGQIAVPVPGGAYTEAAVGSVKILNPVLPESAASADINRLVFSGLTRYNAKRQIVPDLATSWEVSADAKVYTFHLRKGVKWHDGVPFTAQDVAFTLTAVQDPDSRSPLASSWQGVKADIRDRDTIVFTLPTPLASFLDSTTLAIVPRHLLESVEPSQLREAAFNRRPVGTGPFMVKTFAPSAREVMLEANPDYYGGRPKLDTFIFRFYDTSAEALKAYAQHQVLSPGRIRPEDAKLRAELVGLTDYHLTLPEETVLFFQTGDKLLSNKDLREVLARSLDRRAIIAAATADQGIAVSQPLLPGQLGHTTKYADTPLDPANAGAVLDELGWGASGPGAVREKDGRRLEFSLVTLAGGELERAAVEIKRQWAGIGIAIKVKTVDLTELQQTHMRPRNFQMLLFGLNLGADPDIYPFWHSSQAKDPGINISGYNSPEADRALEAARIKTDTAVRAGKYDTFLRAWNTDFPAVVLYETGYDYALSNTVAGFRAQRLVTPADRFYGIEHWTVKRKWVDARP